MELHAIWFATNGIKMLSSLSFALIFFKSRKKYTQEFLKFKLLQAIENLIERKRSARQGLQMLEKMS